MLLVKISSTDGQQLRSTSDRNPRTKEEWAPEGNGNVTLKSYRYAVKEEFGFAWVTRNDRQRLAYLPQKNRPILVYWTQGLDRYGNEIMYLPHSSVFWDFLEWGFLGGGATDSRCPWQVRMGQGVRDSDIPGHWSPTLPWNQRATPNRLSPPSRVKPPWFFLRGDLCFLERTINDVISILSWYPARNSTTRQLVTAHSVNLEKTGDVMFLAEGNPEAWTNSLVIQPQSACWDRPSVQPMAAIRVAGS